MINTAVTNVSSNGGIIIPSQMRKKLNIASGSKICVMLDGASLLIKPMEENKKAFLSKLIKDSRAWAKKEKITKVKLHKMIKEDRFARNTMKKINRMGRI